MKALRGNEPQFCSSDRSMPSCPAPQFPPRGWIRGSDLLITRASHPEALSQLRNLGLPARVAGTRRCEMSAPQVKSDRSSDCRSPLADLHRHDRAVDAGTSEMLRNFNTDDTRRVSRDRRGERSLVCRDCDEERCIRLRPVREELATSGRSAIRHDHVSAGSALWQCSYGRPIPVSAIGGSWASGPAAS